MSNTVTVLIIVVYLVVLFAACAVASKVQAKKTEGSGALKFLMGGKSLPMILVAMMMAGNVIGGASTTGVAESARTVGMSASMYVVAGVIAVLFLAFFGAKRMRNQDYSTTPEMIGAYCGPTSRILVSVGQLINMMCVICLQYIAGGAMLSSMMPDVISLEAGIIITAVAFLVLSMVGGLFGASLANLVNVVVIYIGISICLVLALKNAGGWEELQSQINALNMTTTSGGSWFSLTGGLGMATVIGYFISDPINRFTVQSNTQCAFAAKDDKAAITGLVVSAIIVLPIGFISAVFGLISLIQFPDIVASKAMPMVIMSLSPVAAGIGMAGLWAVNISTGVALMMAVTQVAYNDVLNPLLKLSDSKRDMLYTKILLVVVFAVTLVVSFFLNGMVSALITVQCVIPSFGLVVLSILYKPSLLKKHTAQVTMIASYVFFALWLLIPGIKGLFPTPIYVEWPLAIVLFILCYIFDKEPVKIPEKHTAVNS